MTVYLNTGENMSAYIRKTRCDAQKGNKSYTNGNMGEGMRLGNITGLFLPNENYLVTSQLYFMCNSILGQTLLVNSFIRSISYKHIKIILGKTFIQSLIT